MENPFLPTDMGERTLNLSLMPYRAPSLRACVGEGALKLPQCQMESPLSRRQVGEGQGEGKNI